ncbi:hypothetical protein T05_2374 [Trichinella murrelli]|uniref:Uncharacterized protein n=1 Tax=Trichinella murrelli TaxID=144512 RepID=A0A0V0UAX1_9BILA|nr:hypothetical protein T05_2374 [Trichinella murrelli]
MADVCGLHLVTNCCGSMSLVYEGQEGVKRHSIHEPGCGICAQTNPSHGSMPDGSALGIQNGKNRSFEKVKRGRNETHPRHIRRKSFRRAIYI